MMTQNERVERRLLFFASLLIFIYLSPLIFLGENAHIRVHDNLDSNLAWYKVLKNSGEIFGSVHSTIPQIINGVPRNTFGTEWSGIVWLHAMFPTMIAYTLSQAITRFVAFFGMYILLKTHFVTKEYQALIRVGVSLTFALTPFWPSGMLSTLGMPLALWAFLNIRKNNGTWKEYVVLTLLPLYSSFVLGFFFFLFAMGIFWILDLFRHKRLNLQFLLSIAYMTIIFLLVEYRLVHSFLFSTELTSRDEYFHARLPLWRVIRLTFKNFVLGHTHVMTVHGLVILPVTLFALYIIIRNRLWIKEKMFLYLFALNFALSTWYAFWFFKGWLPLTERFHFMDTFNFARFHFLRPLVVYVSFALALKIIWEHSKSRSLISFFIVFQLLVLGAFNDEIIYHKKPSVKEFYAEELFQKIDSHIGLPKNTYRVASIGIHPAIAQYNGFYTLDTYNNFYPLSYKYQFREIISKELEKNKRIRTYFDEWGGRCYLFTDELGKHYMFSKKTKKKLKNVELNIEAFKEMGGRYIFSSVKILNAEENQLSLEETFETKNSHWKIYLYKTT
ncbi:DUF6044 family protein [Bacillus suaedaesalsae]|uniref:YkoS n=1 Tax=Bacillus suaedaesalsae TaxID=2810349 RepID=A0ABS2DHS3_9BACI|nr:DUF6044 family protein [Bacillus suaedaesalsae]MBM6617083.1 hypothetical protein [Bacillus suaedaesalsae]